MLNKPRDITHKVTESGCWECTSHKADSHGYIKVRVNKKQVYLHRIVYEERFGELKKDIVVRHKCDNPKCINPDHLVEGTYADNSKDMINRNRSMQGVKNRAAMLTEQQVLEIFANKTDTNVKLAQKYNVVNGTIRAIRIGKTWKHITKQ